MMKKLMFAFFLMSTTATFAQQKKMQFKRNSANLGMNNKNDTKLTAIGSKITDFDLINAKKDLVFKSDLIKEGSPFVIMLFNPSCGHCQDAARMFADSLNEYSEIPFVLITGENMVNELKTFAEGTGVDKMKNITVAADHSGITSQIFEAKGIPQVMFYDNNNILKSKLITNFHREDMVRELETIIKK